jgi:hypothetical protein
MQTIRTIHASVALDTAGSIPHGARPVNDHRFSTLGMIFSHRSCTWRLRSIPFAVISFDI